MPQYSTYKTGVRLGPGQSLGFRRGKGYYARGSLGVPGSIGSWVNQPRTQTPASPTVPTPPTAPGNLAADNPYLTQQTSAPSAPTPSYGGGGGGAPSLNLANLDFSNDPILARIKAVGQESIAQAEAEAKAARTKLVIGYGDPGLAATLGLNKPTGAPAQGGVAYYKWRKAGGGTSAAQQAQANPFSTLAELKRGYERRNVFDVDRPFSDQGNLFYSSERGRQRALSGESYLRDQAQAQAAVQEQLAQISNQLTQARMSAQTQRIQAEQDAYQRALQQALYSAGV
jgi:hypothetical protein